MAFEASNIPVERYVAYEIDKYAIKVSSHNYPSIEHRGDVFDADFTEFQGFDAVIGGSPCTYWSIAQKKGVRETEAHGIGWNLFQQYVRAIREASPRFFVYENNKSMADAIRTEISATFGFEPILINSALVSAQKRERLYWVGVRNADGTYHKADIVQPKDRGILLKDVIYGMTDRDKARACIASAGRTTTREYFVKSQGNMVAVPVRVGSMPRPNGELSESQAMRVYGIVGKSVGLKGNGGGMGGKTGLYAVPLRVEKGTKQGYVDIEQGDCVDLAYYNCGSTRRGRLMSLKSNCLTTSPAFYQNCGVLDNSIYEVKDGKISIKGKNYPFRLINGVYIIRKLTVDECKRLQTVPDGFDMSVISDTQAYKCLGNGWTVQVIAHLLSSVAKEVA